MLWTIQLVALIESSPAFLHAPIPRTRRIKLHLDNRIRAAAHAVRSGFLCLVGLVLIEALPDEADLPLGLVSFPIGG